jgi:hypothetical protein
MNEKDMGLSKIVNGIIGELAPLCYATDPKCR